MASDDPDAELAPESLRVLTVECGWPIERYKAWLYKTLCQQLLVAGSCSDGDTGADDALAGLSFRSAPQEAR